MSTSSAKAKQVSKSKSLINYTSPYVAILLAVIYTVLIFTLPASNRHVGSYNLNDFQYRVLHFAIVLPTILVWTVAFVSCRALSRYAHLVTGQPDGQPYARLALGCSWLAWGLPITSIINACLKSFAQSHPDMHTATTIIINYLGIVFPLVGFTLISLSSSAMIKKAKLKLNFTRARTIILLYLLAGLAYCYSIFSRLDLHNAMASDNPYRLALPLIVITVIVPYLYIWFIGLLSCYEITMYSTNIGGLLYRRALKLLVVGLVVIIVSSIALQYINGSYPAGAYVTLNLRLLITVLFRIASGVGFLTLSAGALRLKRFEDV